MNIDNAPVSHLPCSALLEIEVDTLWTRDAQGRLLHVRDRDRGPAPLVVLAVCEAGQFAAFNAALPGELMTECWSALLAWDGLPRSAALSVPPASLSVLEEIFSRHSIAADRHGGPSYLGPGGLTPAARSEDITSGFPSGDLGRLGPPEGANWADDEWQELLAGELGPWAMARVGGEVVAVCHSSRHSGQAAEAGVWTHPGHRRSGHAVSTTAAWANLVHESGRLPFYSTSADNIASQAVAARLGLQPIGWLWSLRAPEISGQ